MFLRPSGCSPRVRRNPEATLRELIGDDPPQLDDSINQIEKTQRMSTRDHRQLDFMTKFGLAAMSGGDGGPSASCRVQSLNTVHQLVYGCRRSGNVSGRADEDLFYF